MVAVYEEALVEDHVLLKTLGYLMVIRRSGVNYLDVLLQGNYGILCLVIIVCTG